MHNHKVPHHIRNIIFDLGGVILDIGIKRTKDALGSLGVKKMEELFGLGHAASFFKDHEQGKISDEQFVQEIHGQIEGAVKDEAIIDAWNSMLLKFPEDRIQLLHQLKNKYRLFLFSNTNGIHLKAFNKIFESTYPGRSLDQLFEKVYYSHLVGLRKPDKASFDFILKDKNLKPGETLFIDDAEVNIKGAEAAGLQTIYLPPGKTLMDISF